MAWNNKKNKKILTCIISGGMLWAMANVNHGTVDRDDSGNDKEEIIDRMKKTSTGRRRMVVGRAVDKGDKVTTQ
jgi:hypothetical protein